MNDKYFKFEELKDIKEADEFLMHQQILRYRLLGMSEISIYMAAARTIPIDDVRRYAKIVDSWIENNLARSAEFLSPKDLEKLMAIKKLDFIIEEKIVLYQNEEGNNVKLRIINSMRDDLRQRAELLGLIEKNEKSVMGGGELDIPEMHFDEEMLAKLIGNIKEKTE